MIRLERIGWAPVKGFRLQHLTRAHLAPHGLEHDRDFLVLDGEGGLNQYDISRLLLVDAVYHPDPDELSFTFPDGSVTRGPAAATGEAFTLEYVFPRPIRYLATPLDDVLSAYAGIPVRLARAERPGNGIDVLPVSLVSEASVADLGQRAGQELDSRRFRSNFEISGVAAYEEETWTGRRARLGQAELRFSTGIPRCAITTFDPTTGRREGTVLRTLGRYREPVFLPPRFGEFSSVPMAVYAEVVTPGLVTVGDELVLLDAWA